MATQVRETVPELVARAAEVARDVVAPNAEREDAEAAWPAPAMEALAEAGLMGLHVPAELGGHGQGLFALVAVVEALALESPPAALCFAMHCVGTAVLTAKATAFQREAYLEPIAAGRHITTLALSEPGTGASFWLPEARLEQAGDDYRLTGVKSFVTNGGHADSYIVSTEAAPHDGAEEGTFSFVVLDADLPGQRWADPWRGLGMRSNSSRTLHLEGVPLPRNRLLGEEGDQLWYVFEVVTPYFLTAMAGTYLGVATGALQIAREHLSTRRQAHSGELLGSNPLLAHRLGELWMELEKTRRLIYAAAEAADGGDPDALVGVLASKAAAADAAVALTNEAMTLCGGIGYRENGKLARLLRDARAGHVMSPPTDLLKTWVGRALLGQPLL